MTTTYSIHVADDGDDSNKDIKYDSHVRLCTTVAYSSERFCFFTVTL